MPISGIGGTQFGDKTVGSVGGDKDTKVQDLLSKLQAGSSSSSSGSGGGSSDSSSSSGGGGGCEGGCCNCAGKTNDRAAKVSGV